MKKKNSHNIENCEERCLFYCLRGPQNKACFGFRRMGEKKKKTQTILTVFTFILSFVYLLLYLFFQRIPKSVKKVWLKKTIHFYIPLHKELFIDYLDKRAIIRLNVNIMMVMLFSLGPLKPHSLHSVSFQKKNFSSYILFILDHIDSWQKAIE